MKKQREGGLKAGESIGKEEKKFAENPKQEEEWKEREDEKQKTEGVRMEHRIQIYVQKPRMVQKSKGENEKTLKQSRKTKEEGMEARRVEKATGEEMAWKILSAEDKREDIVKGGRDRNMEYTALVQNKTGRTYNTNKQ